MDFDFQATPDIIAVAAVRVMQRSTVDEIAQIRQLWPVFERLVGLRGRKMYALVDTATGTYTTATPLRADDDPVALGLEVGTLPGGRYRRGRLNGEPDALYAQIGTAMQALVAGTRVDPARPMIEFYRRHDAIELWVPTLD